jgi:hypothetical protein
MQEGFVASTEAAAIVLEGLWWNWRMAKARVSLDVWRSSIGYIATRGGEAIVKTLPGDFGELRRRRRFIVDWMGMRASSESKRQRQGCQSKPFLHIVILDRGI